MEFKIKFAIGEELYVIYKEEKDNIIRLFKDKVTEIVIREDETVYYLDKMCEEFHEEELVKYKDKTTLLYKIDQLIEKGENPDGHNRNN